MVEISILIFILSIVILLPWNQIAPKRNLKRQLTKLKGKTLQTQKVQWQTLVDFMFVTGKQFYPLYKPLLSQKRIEDLRKNLITAGMVRHFDEQNIMGSKMLWLLCVFLMMLVFCWQSPSILHWFLLFLASALAFCLPELIVRARMKQRQMEILRELPSVLNIMAVMTEAGLGFFEAIAQVITHKKSALTEELKIVLDEVSMGILRRDALLRFSKRSQLEDVGRMVAILVQTLEKGASGMSITLKQQAEELWDKRKSRAKEIGQKASIKLFIPMMLFAFPAMMIFLLGPTILEILKMLLRGA